MNPPSRRITDHAVNGLNEHIHVEAIDGPGPGGASHAYDISMTSPPGGPGITAERSFVRIQFQNGPINEAGINGISNEALLAILIDRARGFQNGPFPCRENSIALTHLEEALMWYQKRTRDRQARGVEGYLKP